MARTETVTLTNMCMIYNGERVLVQDRLDEGWGGITFPGGHVEKGESFTDAVIREIYEETGLVIAAPQLCGIKDWQEEDGSRYIVFFYKTDRFSGELQSSGEGEVFWVDLEKLPDMKMASGMNEMLRVFLEDGFSEMYLDEEHERWILK